MARLLACLLLAAAAAADDLDGVVRNVERRTVRRLATLAREADDAGVPRSAATIRRRVLELDPEHAEARRKLGYGRVRGRWRRSADARGAVAALRDADPVLTKQYRRDAALLEEEHLKELIRVCTTYGTPEERRRVLEPFLASRPRRADLHEALGHVRIGRDYVRPGLVFAVKAMPERLARWRATEAVEPEPARIDLDVGLDLAYLRTEDVACATTLDGAGARMAAAVSRTQRFLRELLGGRIWTASPVLFLDAGAYNGLVARLHADPRERALYTRFANYEHTDFYAIRVFRPMDAEERYAHAAGYLTMFERAAPKGDIRANAWLCEGFGYFVAFELFDRGHVSFASLHESARKRAATRPPPSKRTRAACLAWLAGEMRAGRERGLRDLCGRSLNNLDFLASMEAYSFLRFLFLFDPPTARALPAALKERTGGAQVERVDAALRALGGRGLDDLQPLWRAFVVEITQN